MAFVACLEELRDRWLPHMTDAGLERLISLLESKSPLLIHGQFESALPQGCLASHIAWNHPESQAWYHEAGIIWLTRIAGLNPGTSKVIEAWDNATSDPDELRLAILSTLLHEQRLRMQYCECVCN
jgi:hypothetical protein